MEHPTQLADQRHRPLRDLRISLTDRCNFRCVYCMPKEIFGPDYPFLKRADTLDNEEILRLVRAFAQLGARKIRLTGGEPLLRPDIAPLVAALSQVGGIEDLSLTTNGILLARHAPELARGGLQRINLSLDSLDKERFQAISGRAGSPAKVLDGLAHALKAGLQAKVNMVVQKGVNEQDILPMARHFKSLGVPLRFIEFMDVGNTNQWNWNQVVPAKRILETLQSEFDLEPLDPNYRGEVARRYRYADSEAEIGIISSVTEPFCQNCNRARLSADGFLYTCLFASQGHDLKTPLRRGAKAEELAHIVSNIWRKRTDRYSEERGRQASGQRKKIEMSYIGG